MSSNPNHEKWLASWREIGQLFADAGCLAPDEARQLGYDVAEILDAAAHIQGCVDSLLALRRTGEEDPTARLALLHDLSGQLRYHLPEHCASAHLVLDKVVATAREALEQAGHDELSIHEALQQWRAARRRTRETPEVSQSGQTCSRARAVTALLNVLEPDPEYQPAFISDEASVLDCLAEEEEELRNRLERYFGAAVTHDLRQPVWRLADQLQVSFPDWLR